MCSFLPLPFFIFLLPPGSPPPYQEMSGVKNGRRALNFNLHTGGLLTPCVAMATDQGATLMFSFTLVDPSNANSVQLVKLMAASLQTSR